VYSNFEGKEELFLALLEEERGDGKQFANQEQLAPSDLSMASGDDPLARARSWGEHLAGLRPSVRHVALFLEMNAFALRNERTRTWAAEHNQRFFTELGAGLAELFDVPDADHEMLGLVAQSLYVGLEMHGAFTGQGVGDEVFRRAYEMLVHLARASAADRS
jgi:AcrR family transcriptional regulator